MLGIFTFTMNINNRLEHKYFIYAMCSLRYIYILKKVKYL